MHKPKLIWLNATIFALSALITLIIVPIYALTIGFDGWQVAAMIGGIIFCEISITAGYHRLWSHRAYEAHWTVRLLFAIGGTYATQNTILHWCSDHREHHRHTDDNEKDPYSAKQGFWYSHIGWMIREYGINQNTGYKNCTDLKKDPIVMWQHKHYLPLVLGINFGIPIVLGLIHGDLIGMLLLAGVARLFISHHFTFLINSLAHIWGRQPYSDKNSSKDNDLLAFLTMGEGYHNYHHSFQRDYRNGIRWWQFDPTKWLIHSLSWLKLTRNLYRAPLEYIEASRAEMLLRKTSQKLEQLPHADILKQRLQAEYEVLISKINEFAQAKRLWLEAQKNSMQNSMKESCDIESMKRKVDQLKHSVIQQRKDWMLLNARLA